MKAITENELLEGVKSALGITGNYQDATLTVYINEVKGFLADAGVSREVLSSAVCLGVISRGVADLWSYGSGEGRLSAYFKMRAVQLAYKGDE